MKTNKWLVLLAVAIPMLMIEMAGTSIFVAMEPIASDLNVGIDRSVWLTTLYLAVNAMMIPLAGWLGKRFGYKRVILSSVVVFGVSAFLGAIARHFDALVLFRALQGLGDGPIMPVATALLFETFPANQRGKMTVGVTLAVGIAPALGPLLAAWIVGEIGWRAIFFMNVIWAAAAFIAVSTLLPKTPPSSENVKVNWAEFFMLAVATVSLQLFLDRGQHYDWFYSRFIWGLFIAFVVSIMLYMVVAFVKKSDNVLEFKILKDIPFLTGSIASMILWGALYGSLMLKIFYLQWLMGFTPVHSGNYQVILAGTMLVFSVIAGALTDKINPRWPIILGLPLCVFALFMTSRLSLASDMGSILIIGVIMGAGLAFVSVPLSVTVFASISRKDMGSASVLNSYLSVMSTSVALALVMTLLMHRIDVNALNLASAITSGNPAFERAVYMAGQDVAMAAAHGHIARQAAMFAFNDVWYLMAFVLALVVFYLPFVKKPVSQ